MVMRVWMEISLTGHLNQYILQIHYNYISYIYTVTINILKQCISSNENEKKCIMVIQFCTNTIQCNDIYIFFFYLLHCGNDNYFILDNFLHIDNYLFIYILHYDNNNNNYFIFALLS